MGFIRAGRGYEEERCWETEEVRAWRRGEGTAEGPKQPERENRNYFQDRFDGMCQYDAFWVELF